MQPRSIRLKNSVSIILRDAINLLFLHLCVTLLLGMLRISGNLDEIQDFHAGDWVSFLNAWGDASDKLNDRSDCRITSQVGRL